MFIDPTWQESLRSTGAKRCSSSRAFRNISLFQSLIVGSVFYKHSAPPELRDLLPTASSK